MRYPTEQQNNMHATGGESTVDPNLLPHKNGQMYTDTPFSTDNVTGDYWLPTEPDARIASFNDSTIIENNLETHECLEHLSENSIISETYELLDKKLNRAETTKANFDPYHLSDISGTGYQTTFVTLTKTK